LVKLSCRAAASKLTSAAVLGILRRMYLCLTLNGVAKTAGCVLE
jgi:hypothetical protein